jgi:hypothetical protein
MVIPGEGVLYATYVSWALFYDIEFTASIIRLLNSAAAPDSEIAQMIDAWHSHR